MTETHWKFVQDNKSHNMLLSRNMRRQFPADYLDWHWRERRCTILHLGPQAQKCRESLIYVPKYSNSEDWIRLQNCLVSNSIQQAKKLAKKEKCKLISAQRRLKYMHKSLISDVCIYEPKRYVKCITMFGSQFEAERLYYECNISQNNIFFKDMKKHLKLLFHSIDTILAAAASTKDCLILLQPAWCLEYGAWTLPEIRPALLHKWMDIFVRLCEKLGDKIAWKVYTEAAAAGNFTNFVLEEISKTAANVDIIVVNNVSTFELVGLDQGPSKCVGLSGKKCDIAFQQTYIYNPAICDLSNYNFIK